LKAACRALAIPDNAREKHRGTDYYRGTIWSKLQQRDYSIVLTSIGGPGNPRAAAATTAIIERFDPRAAFLMGIAAGMREEIKIGEVVLSERVVAYEPAVLKSTADGISQEQRRPKIDELVHTMNQDIESYLAHTDEERLTVLFLQIGGVF